MARAGDITEQRGAVNLSKNLLFNLLLLAQFSPHINTLYIKNGGKYVPVADMELWKQTDLRF